MSNEFGDAALTAGSGAPEAYKQAGMAMVISGLTNIMVGLLWTCMGLSTCVSTYGICFFCPFMGVIPLAVGVYEILEGNKVQCSSCHDVHNVEVPTGSQNLLRIQNNNPASPSALCLACHIK